MTFSEFAKYLQKLEETSKRLEITSILAELIKNSDPEEIDITMYLASGYLKAPFESEKFNIADKMMVKILENVFGNEPIEDMYKKEGDLGNVAFKIKQKKDAKEVSITHVYKKLLNIATTEGTGSQTDKISLSSELIKSLDPLSAKYVVRIILGTLRLGFTELTIIAALAKFLDSKEKTKEIEAVYSTHPDIGLIAKQLVTKGMKGLSEIGLVPGIPYLSQKPQRVSGMQEAYERIPHLWAEYKFDGTRVQLHIDRNTIEKSNKAEQTSMFSSDEEEKFLLRTYTRNLEESTHQYPEIVAAMKKQFSGTSAIFDGEAIGYNKETGDFLPFQETIQRKRKHNISQAAIDIPLKYFVFDILYLDGKSLVNKTLKERREILNKVIKKGPVIKVDEYVETDEFEALKEYYEDAKAKGLEGLVIKNPDDPYQAGARSYSWIKLKKADEKLLEDSIDCVLLGYYAGKGVRSKFGIGGFLVGVYDEKTDSFKTISKIGTGVKDIEWGKLKKLADQHVINTVPKNVKIDKSIMPDVIVSPKIVLEIGADEISKSPMHSAGYALRFPRLLKFRTDKPAIESTSIKEVEKLFNFQRNGS